jgi:hypothetical protein
MAACAWNLKKWLAIATIFLFWQKLGLFFVKYLNTAKIIDNSLLLAIVLRNYSTKPSYIFQLKRELTVWIYIFNHSTSKSLSKTKNEKIE